MTQFCFRRNCLVQFAIHLGVTAKQTSSAKVNGKGLSYKGLNDVAVVKGLESYTNMYFLLFFVCDSSVDVIN
ncbi:CLUMA_CG019372, isoform A [Clunio marinus]|uniref:CLUMA_CG019372, isoform A n=1 Tax=Clunio marinus TaxID=568069 RepID=A0A1J1J3K7_9DIPT|nr:CLUMA_CG019372, isoform A [Clunio marinus]